MAATWGLPDLFLLAVLSTVASAVLLLKAARDMGAVIVTNDRFRDWAEEYPEVAAESYLIKGGYRDGALWLWA